MRHYLFLLILLSTCLIFKAQTSVKIENSIASLDGKQWLIIMETQMGSSSDYEVIKTLQGDIIAQLTFTRKGGVVAFRGEFPVAGKYYVTSYPEGSTILTVLESFNKNRVIVDSKIDLVGLEKYCSDRKIPLQKILTEEDYKKASASIPTNTNGSGNKTDPPKKTTNLDLPPPKIVSFTLVNNCTKTIRYFIGKEAKYGSGSYTNLGGNTQTSEHGTAGEKFCIVDEQNNPISCMIISDGMDRVEISKSGTGFGN